MVLSRAGRVAAFNHVLDVVLDRGDGSPLKTALIADNVTTIERHRSERHALSAEQQAARQLTDVECHRRQRNALAVEQQAATQLADAQRHRNPQNAAAIVMAARQCNIDTFDELAVERFSLGEYNLECMYCGGIGFKSENRGPDKKPYFGILCCNKGKIDLPLYPPLPPYLRHLVTSNDADSIYFRRHSRKFNSGLSMASLQVQDKTVQRGPAAFKVCGQVHRRVGPLLPSDGETATCLQLI